MDHESNRYKKVSSKQQKLTKEQTSFIFDAVEKCFSGNYTLHSVPGYGKWTLELTDDNGEVFKIEGPLINEFPTENGDLSEMIRNTLGDDELFLFDRNRGYFDEQK